MDQSSYMKHLYIQAFQNPDPLDLLSNKDYKAHIAEPKYVSIVSLSHSLPQHLVRYIVEYTIEKDNDELSMRTNRRLRKSIEDGHYNLFEFIYLNEYMEANIVDFFEFREDTPNDPHKLYKLCTCPRPCGCLTHTTICGYCEPIMFCRYVYIKGCTCRDGKRFLAFSMVYKEYYEVLKLTNKTKTTTTTTTNKKTTTSYQKMIDLINSSGAIDTQFTLHAINHTGVI